MRNQQKFNAGAGKNYLLLTLYIPDIFYNIPHFCSLKINHQKSEMTSSWHPLHSMGSKGEGKKDYKCDRNEMFKE